MRPFMSQALLSFGFLFTTSLAASAHADVKAFDVDKNHTILGFKASTLLFDVPGRFDKYKVDISGDPNSPDGAKVRVELDARSINTENKTRDMHLQSPDFFDAAKYPKVVFTSDKVTKEGGKIVVSGTLEMHGVKKDIKVPFDTVTAKNGAGIDETVFKAEVPLNRKDYGIGSDSIGAKISLKDQITLNLLLAGFFEEPKAKKVK